MGFNICTPTLGRVPGGGTRQLSARTGREQAPCLQCGPGAAATSSAWLQGVEWKEAAQGGREARVRPGGADFTAWGRVWPALPAGKTHVTRNCHARGERGRAVASGKSEPAAPPQSRSKPAGPAGPGPFLSSRLGVPVQTRSGPHKVASGIQGAGPARRAGRRTRGSRRGPPPREACTAAAIPERRGSERARALQVSPRTDDMEASPQSLPTQLPPRRPRRSSRTVASRKEDAALFST
ncbi:uncharacterized protein LOC142870552 [Microcebus murinus]|uniref:uncharacterized protein LOC142870552 n=1 Tax=Microcebus murinus TaxID=30608 RepID=UPI003F6AB8B0